MLFPLHAVCFNDLGELLGERAQIVGEEAYTQKHYQV
jgi:hypothetical protein